MRTLRLLVRLDAKQTPFWRAVQNWHLTYLSMIGQMLVPFTARFFVRTPFVVLFVAALPILSGGCSSIPQGPSASQGLPNFSKVDDSLYRGAQPSPKGIEKLREMKITSIIDLRQPNEERESRSEEQHAAHAAGLRYYPVPMTGRRAPTQAELDRVFTLLEDPSNQPVFIHCRRGADRTGTIVAIYRISHHGWTASQAIQEAMDHGMAWQEFCLRRSVRQWEKDRPKLSNPSPPQ